MTPSLPVPTDNIYKFSCLFGLVLIVVSVFSFVSVYNSSLESKIKYNEAIITLEAKPQRSKEENERLEMNKKLIEVTKANENMADTVLGVVAALGIMLCGFGGYDWFQKVQKRDDRFMQLQLEKLEAEVAKLNFEVRQAKRSSHKW
jgi:hypothetical protein